MEMDRGGQEGRREGKVGELTRKGEEGDDDGDGDGDDDDDDDDEEEEERWLGWR